MAPFDRDETIFAVEPLIPEEGSKHRGPLTDLVLELTESAAHLRGSIPSSIRTSLAEAVRSMNCYYSNLIEGHNTHPIDIERALNADFSDDPTKRDLQREAVAHINVQRWIDDGGLDHHPMHPLAICEIHRRFCDDLPPDLLFMTADDGTRIPIIGGALRDRDVQVGRHVAPSPGAVPRLLDHMHRMYSRAGRMNAVIGAACAHHRLNWVHPFLDLNGRVTRIVSHAMLLQSVPSDGLWSVSRGLARAEAEYKSRLMAADDPRHGGADGRGALSEQRLAEFAAFFLTTCIDQTKFMAQLMQPMKLRDRILTWARGEMGIGQLPLGSDTVMQEILFSGQLDRAAIPPLLGVGDRQARKVTSELIKRGALRSDSTRAPLILNFSPRLAPDWMPGLFPDTPV